MAITVWTERQAGKWTDCVFSAYGMALEYAGFTAFPLGAGTAAQREAFAGPLTTGATLAQADSRSQATFGTKLQPLDTSLTKALARPGYAYVVTGNYSKLSPNSDLVSHVYGWNNYDTSNPLPSVDHAVTIITNADGTLTWLDPTAPQGASGIPVTAAEVMQFNGGNITDYPVRQIKQDAYVPAKAAGEALGSLSLKNQNALDAGPLTGSFDKYVGKTYGELSQDATVGKVFQGIMTTLGKQPTDTFTQADSTSAGIAITEAAKGGGSSAWDGVISTIRQIDVNVLSAVLPGMGVVLGITGAANGTPSLDPLSQLASTATSITNPANWIHIGAILAGVALIGFALYIISKDVASPDAAAPSTPSAPIVLKEGA